MSLHASVFCNCFEIGNVRTPPPDPDGISVMGDGSLSYKNEDFEKVLAFDRWQRDSMCEHENGVLLGHCIGNTALVAMLRSEFERAPSTFPLLLEKIVYNGVHAGDYLTLEEVSLLNDELRLLGKFVATDSRNQSFVDAFADQLLGLVNAALSVRKPISF